MKIQKLLAILVFIPGVAFADTPLKEAMRAMGQNIGAVMQSLQQQNVTPATHQAAQNLSAAILSASDLVPEPLVALPEGEREVAQLLFKGLMHQLYGQSLELQSVLLSDVSGAGPVLQSMIATRNRGHAIFNPQPQQ